MIRELQVTWQGTGPSKEITLDGKRLLLSSQDRVSSQPVIPEIMRR